MKNQDLPNCYSYLSIASNGVFVLDGKHHQRFQAAENGLFLPQDITAMLGIKPFRAFAANDVRTNGTVYGFSRWNACRCDTPLNDAGEQCLAIVRRLHDKIHILNEIRERYAVGLTLQVVAYSSENGETPALYFPREVIEFCYISHTEIDVDWYAA